jgi:polar amino acid transport system permease protein
MTVNGSVQTTESPLALRIKAKRTREALKDLPWWVAGVVIIFLLTAAMIMTRANYQNAFSFIRAGLAVTIQITLISFGIALILGLITGMGRISKNIAIKNIATLYVELVRGIPMLVLIFFIAFVGVPAAVNGLKAIGDWLVSIGLSGLGMIFLSLENSAVPMTTRAILALSITYGAFLAEIFRAGIQSIGKGQMEAARAQGLSYWQAMRYVILPQAIRNVLPALGNDFVSMLKDSSLVSVLAVRDITQIAKLYAGRSFQYQESYITLAVLYLSMTIILSFFVKLIEKKYQQNERS